MSTTKRIIKKQLDAANPCEVSYVLQKQLSRFIVKKAKKSKILPSDCLQSVLKKSMVITFLLNRNEKGKLQAMIVNVSMLVH